MKEFAISKKRWEQLLTGLVRLGKGKLDQQLLIKHLNDDFESLEALFNLVNEELRERLIHLSFVKPSEYQKYAHHFIFTVNKDFVIKNVCDSFIRRFHIDFSSLKNQSFLHLIDEDTAKLLKDPDHTAHLASTKPQQSLVLLNQTFLFNIKKLYKTNTLVINLYQLHLDSRLFPHNLTDQIEKGRLKQKRRNEDIIEQVKLHLDNRPLSHKLSLKQLCMDFGINSNQLKKLFREQYQCSVYEYHISLRMRQAYLLIETGTLPFKEIADMVGYPQYSAFVNYFKTYYNILPKELRMKQHCSEKNKKSGN